MTSSLDVVVLQHIACEPPGVYEDVLLERGATIERVELDEGEALPERRDFDAVIAMGGPMGVNDEDAHPWLGAEKRFVDIRYWNELDRSGHFAAFEQPKIFVDEVRSFFRLVR